MFTYLCYVCHLRALFALVPLPIVLVVEFLTGFCKSYWNSELIFKGPNLRSLFLSKHAMNFINIYMSNYPNISGYMSPLFHPNTPPIFKSPSPQSDKYESMWYMYIRKKSGIATNGSDKENAITVISITLRSILYLNIPYDPENFIAKKNLLFFFTLSSCILRRPQKLEEPLICI